MTPGFKPFTVLLWTLLWRLYTYLLRHVFPSPSPRSLLGRWREYVFLYFLHVLFRPQLRLVSFFFYCLNNPCCIFKQNFRLTDRLNVLLLGLVNVQISRTMMNGGKHSGDPVFSSYVTSVYFVIGNEPPMQGKWSCLCIRLVILPENRKNLVCNNVVCGSSRTAPIYYPGVAEAPFKSKRMLSSSHLGIEIAYYDIIV